jgi:putative RNA 2'-phosphotransferase
VDRGRAQRVGRFLSLVLRHQPDAADVALDAFGWVAVDVLLAGAARRGFPIERAELDEVVRTNDKQRFAVSEDGQRIRASQGHSVAVDLGLAATAPPAVLYHGTVERFVASILRDGLEKRARRHVHLSVDVQTATRVGARRGAPVLLRVDAAAMHAAGHAFFLSSNGVWLTEHVPPRFIARH